MHQNAKSSAQSFQGSESYENAIEFYTTAPKDVKEVSIC